MKNLKIPLLLLISILIFSTCKKDEDDPVMTAKIDGTDWVSITRVTKRLSSPESFVITGTSAGGQVIVITVKGVAEDTYSSSTSIDSLSAQVGCIWQADASFPSSDNYLSKSGQVKISEIDTKNETISGTFSFELFNVSEQKSITEGVFSYLKYSASE